ncbi:MAG: hypothetical protein IT361_03095 [Gemmatimonadaceae bacterium]|nr:hypothetical protein [Gemmatimonadaceae bacterium]
MRIRLSGIALLTLLCTTADAQAVAPVTFATCAGPCRQAVTIRPTIGALPHVMRTNAGPSGQESRPTRGAVARRGLLWGAIIGGVIGFFAGQSEEYGGAVSGAVVGGVIGAPIGMIVFLFATPI